MKKWKFKEWICQPSVTSFGDKLILPLWKSVLYDYTYPFVVIFKFLF